MARPGVTEKQVFEAIQSLMAIDEGGRPNCNFSTSSMEFN